MQNSFLTWRTSILEQTGDMATLLIALTVKSSLTNDNALTVSIIVKLSDNIM